MSLSPPELVRLAAELQALTGARAQKLFVPAPRTLVVELRLPGRSVLLLLEAEPGVARAGVVGQRPPSPEKAFTFQGLVRAHLTGARLDLVEVEPAARLLRLRFSTDAGPRVLALEALPKGGALLLLDVHDSIIGASAGERAKEPGYRRGEQYRPLTLAPDATSGRDRFADATGEAFPVSAAIERTYGVVVAERSLTRVRSAVVPALRSAKKRTQRTLEKIRADRSRIEEAARYLRLGDLLKPHVGRLKRGLTTAKVIDYTQEGIEEVEVPLLPHLSARENMERYYHLHRRLSRSAGRVDERLAEIEALLAKIQALLAEAEAADDEAAFEALAEKARDDGVLREPRAAATKAVPEGGRLPYREFTSAAGQRIWVGRGARDNDVLTFKVARGNDLWLHARGWTGSHVVVPGAGPEGPDGETLLDAAMLAAHFSSGRDELIVDVAATRRKHVQKPKGAAAGAVRFSQERTIQLRHEPARLERLLAGETLRS